MQLVSYIHSGSLAVRKSLSQLQLEYGKHMTYSAARCTLKEWGCSPMSVITRDWGTHTHDGEAADAHGRNGSRRPEPARAGSKKAPRCGPGPECAAAEGRDSAARLGAQDHRYDTQFGAPTRAA